jgi:hypothetical protein
VKRAAAGQDGIVKTVGPACRETFSGIEVDKALVMAEQIDV